MGRRSRFAILNPMNGLYALKPWYAQRLRGLREVLVARHVSPNALTVAGVAFGVSAGATFFLVKPGPIAGVCVALLLSARLACANLDGSVARQSGRGTRFGVVANELGDRLAEFAALAGALALTSPSLVAAAALAGTLPSWAALAGAAAGASRVQGGPVGKTERAALLAVIAFTGWAAPLLCAYAIGSAATAALRLARVRRELAS